MELVINSPGPLGVQFNGKAARAKDRKVRIGLGAVRLKTWMMSVSVNEDIKVVVV